MSNDFEMEWRYFHTTAENIQLNNGYRIVQKYKYVPQHYRKTYRISRGGRWLFAEVSLGIPLPPPGRRPFPVAEIKGGDSVTSYMVDNWNVRGRVGWGRHWLGREYRSPAALTSAINSYDGKDGWIQVPGVLASTMISTKQSTRNRPK